MSAIQLRDYSWKYFDSENWALRGVKLEVEKGEFVGIMGPSGAGKTTLCLTLNGLIPHRINGSLEGEVRILGRSIHDGALDQFASQVGLVFQDPESQFVSMSVKNEIAFGMENYGLSRDEMLSRLNWATDLLGLGSMLNRSPIELSGGEKQRVAIASVLVLRPEIFVFDEPTSDLDPLGKEQVHQAISQLREELDATMIVVEHEVEELARFADRLVLMDNGRILLDEKPDRFFEDVDKILELGETVPQVTEYFAHLRKKGIWKSGLPRTLEDAEKAVRTITVSARGKNIQKDEVDQRPQGEKAEILVEDLWHIFPDGSVALKGVSLDVARGEYVAVIGQNGSGKTKLVKHFNGLLKPTKGKVTIKGINVLGPRSRELAKHVAYVFQNPDHQLFCSTVWDEALFAPLNLGMNEEEAKKSAEEILRLLNLSEFRKEHPFFLGKGQRRRLALASVLSLRPSILVVDEPTTGQDWKGSKEIMLLLDKLNSEGRTIIVVTHNMRLVAEHCRRAIVMSSGRKIFDGTVRSLFTSQDVLKEASLRSPQITAFSQRLIDLGLPADVLSVQELLDATEI